MKSANSPRNDKEKPLINQPATDNNTSFSIMVRPCIDLVFPYHMHTGYQLNLVIEGKGTRVVGDHSENYSVGDLVLIGPNLPHYWSYDQQYLATHGKGKAVIIHFDRDFAGVDFMRKSELTPVLRLLDRAYRGLCLEGSLRHRVMEIMSVLESRTPLEKLIGLINILTDISLSAEYRYLAGPAFEKEQLILPEEEIKIKRIIHFMKTHYADSGLRLQRLAQMAAMSATGFSKYFKKHTGQNYIEVLTNLRLSEACKRLAGSDCSIAQIAYQCGYNNLSNFNKHFRQKYQCTPKEYIATLNTKEGF